MTPRDQQQIATSLAGGDRRTLGAARRLVTQTLRDPSLVDGLFRALRSSDPVVPRRAAGVLEKVSRRHPDWLAKYRARLIQIAADASDPAVRWNLIQIFPRLPNSARTLRPLARRLEVWFLNDDSAIVRACAQTEGFNGQERLVMPTLTISDSTTIPAPASVVYGLIADYRAGHPSILPRKYFENLVVDEGGTGAGTKIHFTMLSYGKRQVMHARVTEPEPGRVLVETYEQTGTETRFTVEPLGPSSARVTFETQYRTGGIKGWFEALLVPRYLRKVYAAELSLLGDRAVAAYRGGT